MLFGAPHLDVLRRRNLGCGFEKAELEKNEKHFKNSILMVF